MSPAGLYEYMGMPFGLRNAPASFQRFIDNVLADFPFKFNYVDDVLIFSENFNEHLSHLAKVFRKISSAQSHA